MISNDPLFDDVAALLDSEQGVAGGEEALWDEHGQTCAVLVLDSTGFTRTTRSHGVPYYLALIVRLRQVGADIFRQHGAVRWRAHADNLGAEFETVDQAVGAAMALHGYFDNNAFEIDKGDRFGVCIGIGYGRMLLSIHDGMYGDEINLASKLGEDTATRGETLLTENAYAALVAQEKYAADKRSVNLSGFALTHYALHPLCC